MDRRRLEETAARWAMGLAVAVLGGCLLLLLGTVVVKGAPHLSLSMVFTPPSGGFYMGKGGGLLNALAGSLYLAGGATILAALLGLPIALGLNFFARGMRSLVRVTRFSLDVLCGVPSIVYGAFGYTLMLYLGLRASLLAGIIVVALLILPIVSRAMDEALQAVSPHLTEAAYSLGATRWETAIGVAVRQAMPAMATAVLIAFGRAVGDAAAVLFTAGFTDRVPDSLLGPAATLPLAVFFQAGSPFPAVRQQAYAAALILTILILGISIACRLLSRLLSRYRVG